MPRRRVVMRYRAAVEPLERRTLLSTITWANRAVGDNFAQYGANANLARAIVARAIDDWERVVTDFNYASGGNEFVIRFTAQNNAGVGWIGGGNYDASGKPIDADVQLGGGSYYFDPTPGSAALPDDAEFATPADRFRAFDSGSGLVDFYYTVSAALASSLGINLSPQGALGAAAVNTGVSDSTNPGGFIYRFDALFGTYTLTQAGGGFLYDGPAVGELPSFAGDLANRTLGAGQRRLISDVDALLLGDAYGYTVTLPSQLNTFHANYNTVTGTLILRGEPGTWDDTITFASGAAASVSVNDATETFASVVTSLQVFGGDGGDGDDGFAFDDSTGDAGTYTVTASSVIKTGLPAIFTSGLEHVTVTGSGGDDIFNYPSAGPATTFNGGDGDDVFNVNSTPLGSGTAAQLALNGGGGFDSFNIGELASTGTATYTISTTDVKKNSEPMQYQDVESIQLSGGAAAEDVSVAGLGGGVSLTILTGAGDDSLAVTPSGLAASIDGSILADLGGGTGDAITVSDTGNNFIGDVVHVTESAVGAFPSDQLWGAGGSFTYQNAETLTVNGSKKADRFYVRPSSSTVIKINGDSPISAPGDELHVATASATDATVTPAPFPAGSGSVTFSNRQRIDYTGVEITPDFDSVAPIATDISLTASPGAQALAFSFNADVAPSLDASRLLLFNNTAGGSVDAADIGYGYGPGDLATFTFPGLGGTLPSGSYSASLLGAADLYGNEPVGPSTYHFIWSAGTSGDDQFRVTADGGGYVLVYENANPTSYFASAAVLDRIALSGGDGDDAVVFELAEAPPLPALPDGTDWDGGGGTNWIGVRAGLADDAVTFAPGVVTVGSWSATHANDDHAAYDGGGGVDELTIADDAGVVTLLASQPFSQITVGQNAVLDVRDHRLVLTAMALGSWTGSAYDGVSGLIAAGHNGGAWDGARGIVTSMPDAAGGLTSLGVASASDVLGIAPGETALWNGHSVDGSSVLVKYTYAGDANLDGVVSGDDYSGIDFSILVPGSFGWYAGDFNFDGMVSGDDYSAIDFNLLAQGGPL